MDSTRIKGQEEPDKIFNITFISVFVANMLLQLGQQMMNTLVAKYADTLGATAALVGFVVGIFAFSSLIFKVVAAPAIDTFNKKYILMGAVLIMAVSYGGYSFSYNIYMLMFFRMLQGVGQAFTITCCLALASEALPASRLGTGLAYFSLAQAVCQAIGPTVGLYLSNTFGFRTAFIVGAVIMLAAAFAAARIKIPFKKVKKFRITLESVIAKEAVVPAVIMFFLMLTYSNINSFLVIYAGEKGCGANIGFFFTVYALTLLFTRPVVGRLADKFGLSKMFLPAMCCFALAFFLISCAGTLPALLFAAFVSAFGYGACYPLVQTLCMKCVPGEKRGAASSTNYIGSDFGQMLGPSMAGMIADHLGYTVMWRIMILPIFMAMAMVVIFRKKIDAR